MAAKVELEEIEEGAGDERTKNEATPPLDYRLERDYETHGNGPS